METKGKHYREKANLLIENKEENARNQFNYKLVQEF